MARLFRPYWLSLVLAISVLAGCTTVLRDYPASAVRSGGPSQRQVVFTLDLTTADGLFAARKFPIHHGDLAMATESPVTNLRTVLGLIGSAFGVVTAVEN